jgi:uncharacterized protein YqgV (UPF0045/DUF77 family)
LTGLVSIFLSIHPFGTCIENVVSYIRNVDKNITTQEIENLLVTNQILFEHCQHNDNKSLWKLVNFR